MIETILPLISAVLTGLLGWYASAYRNKQKKERDVLDNVQQILDMESKQISLYAERLAKRDTEFHKLEQKYDHKVSAVKEAYDCVHPSESCPVLIYDKKMCEDCIIKNSVNATQ